MIQNINSFISLFIFCCAYLLFILLPERRSLVALTAAFILILFKVISLSDAFLAINWNVMGIFVGMLVVAESFMASRVPAVVAEKLVNASKNTAWALLAICILTSFISAFVENVATVLIMAPIAISLCQKLKINPTNVLIAIAVSSNLQGTATLIGDPPSMLLGGFAKMNFLDFFFYQGKPSIFFAVELGALSSFIVLYFLFRKYRQKTQLIELEKVNSWVPTIVLIVLIFALVVSSFWDKGCSFAAGKICMVFALLVVCWEKIYNKKSVWQGIKKLDWDTTFFLMGIFILVGSLTYTGWISRIATGLSKLVGANLFIGYTTLVVLAVILSAFVDNVPFLAAMLPLAIEMAQTLGISPSLFLFGLLIGASLGGNITPIGASANIVACGLLKKEGYPVRFGQFVRIGGPFTVAAVSVAYIFIWLVWSKV
ncbi:MAG: SLC13 family permease [Candidatus Omnitrophica bacterium]|nr:SLC13 family permease [Candidatus Omnitrophota bacterium]